MTASARRPAALESGLAGDSVSVELACGPSAEAVMAAAARFGARTVTLEGTRLRAHVEQGNRAPPAILSGLEARHFLAVSNSGSVGSTRPDTGPMHISRRMIVLDAADLDAESAFWAGLLGGTVSAGDRWHSIWVDGTWQLGIQLARNHVPPDWPDGTPPQQIHFDLYFDDVRDLDAAHEEVIRLGGRLLKVTADRTQVSGAQVYADPAGHPFCLCWLPPQVGDRVKLTYPDSREVEGVWAEEDDSDNRLVPVLRLDDGTIHRDVAGDGRRRVIRGAND